MQKLFDLSSNNPHPVNLQALKDNGFSGGWVKATEADSYTNPYFGSDYFSILNLGMTPGAYHFHHPEVDLGSQLRYFRSRYTPRVGDLLPMWDIEVKPSWMSWPTLAEQLMFVANWMHNNYEGCVFYVPRYFRDNLAPSGFPFGQRIGLATGLSDTPEAWGFQWAPVGVPGVSGLVDVWSV